MYIFHEKILHFKYFEAFIACELKAVFCNFVVVALLGDIYILLCLFLLNYSEKVNCIHSIHYFFFKYWNIFFLKKKKENQLDTHYFLLQRFVKIRNTTLKCLSNKIWRHLLMGQQHQSLWNMFLGCPIKKER